MLNPSSMLDSYGKELGGYKNTKQHQPAGFQRAISLFTGVSVRRHRLLALAMAWPAVMEVIDRHALGSRDTAVTNWLRSSVDVFDLVESFADRGLDPTSLQLVHAVCLPDYVHSARMRATTGRVVTQSRRIDELDDKKLRHALRVAHRVSTEPGSEGTILETLASGYDGIFDSRARSWQSACIIDVLEGHRQTVPPLSDYTACDRCRWKRPDKNDRCKHVAFFVSSNVSSLANNAYNARNKRGVLDDTSLSVLADALEDDGFPTSDHPALKHLRTAGPHVKGCWGLDWVLAHWIPGRDR